MKNISLSPTILILLPSITIIPVLIIIATDLHAGGFSLISAFFYSLLIPSTDIDVIKSALTGLQITIATAIFSWVLSSIIGIILGFIGSNIIWETLGLSQNFGIIIRRALAIPRSIHEMIWGILLLQIFGLNYWIAIIAITIPYSALLARVISSQLDALNDKPLKALKQSGVNPMAALTTSLLPGMIPIIFSYCGYRLECAIRGATLLGVFGLGGIGTELQLTFESLEFREMWTSLWILGITMFILERLINYLLKKPLKTGTSLRIFIDAIIISLFSLIISIFWLKELGIDLTSGLSLNTFPLPSIYDFKIAYQELHWFNLISSTLLITFLAAGIAIGLPPLIMMTKDNSLYSFIQNFIFLIARLIPAPISALLILLCSSPSLAVAAISLGLHNMGVMGRLLKESIENENRDRYNAVKCFGTAPVLSSIYGKLTLKSNQYLAYACYRSDVILRETAVVGVVGGVGLGWQLRESISSFNWAQVILITTAYGSLTMIGEIISDNISKNLLKSAHNNSFNLIFPSTN